MNGKTSSILIFGHDTMLLNTRLMILQNQGYHAVTVNSLAALEAVALQPAFQILMLSHFVDQLTAIEALNRATFRWPLIRSLSLVQSVLKPTTGRPGRFVRAPDEPKTLLASVGAFAGETQPADSRAA
jgi:DNA-binding NtrC family response regulator